MEMQEVTVVILPSGEVKIEVNGVKGGGCLELTEQLEKALGTVSAREMTPEAHQQVEVQQDTHVWGG